MRAQLQQIKLLEIAGADEDDIINARCRYHGTSQDYTVFSKAMNLPQQRARVTADGLGNIRVEKMKKRAKYSLDPDNNRVCSARAEGWHSRAESLKSQTDKEKIKDIIPTQEQKNAIENYVSGDGMYVSHYLRDGEKAVAEMGELRKEDKELISNLEKATSIKHDNKVLYRSVDASAVFGDISQSEYDALRDKLMYGFENKNATDLIDNAVGKTVTDNGFMSTTKDKAAALDFDGFTGSEKPIVIEFENADKALGFELEKHMPELDKQMEQSEVLLHNGTQYKIKGVGVAQDEYGGKSIYVKAEIVDDKLSESVAKSADGGIINTGAFSGAKKTPGWQDRHGKKMYEEIRHRKTDVKKISENTNFKESAVEEIKQHMFYQKHKFKNGTIRQFDYDFDQAQSWDRLSQGKGTKTDLILLKHEYVELTQMRLHDYDYETAHDIANKYHNWAKAIIEEMK